MAKKTVKSPAGYHWMGKGKDLKLMKHKGKFKPHKGASLKVKFNILKQHD